MDASARGPAPPAPVRSIQDTAASAFELGELFVARTRLRAPRWRLHALLALIPAARALGLSTRVMERESRACLDRLLAGRRVGTVVELEPRVRERLDAWIAADAPAETCRADLLQGLAASLSTPGREAPLHAAQALLAAGRRDEARRLAAEWPDPVLRRRLEVLAATGIRGKGADRRFVGDPFNDGFPPSLPRFLAMARAPLDEARRSRAEALLARFEGAERQTALAGWAGAAYRAGGLDAAERVVRAVRYQSRRRLARLNVLVASLEAGSLDDAWRAFRRIPGGHRQRARLLLARELVRRGRERRALRLLGEPVQGSLRQERTLLLCEALPDARRVERAWTRWRALASSVRSEDLAAFDPGTLRLEPRWTILALRAALAGGLPGDDRQWIGATCWIPKRSFRALAHDRAALRAWLLEIEHGAVPLAPVLHGVRWIAEDAVEAIWAEHLSVRAGRLLAPRRRDRGLPPRRVAEAFVRGLSAGPEERVAEGPAVSAERCAADEGVSLSPHAPARRRVVLGAVKHCLGSWLVEGTEPAPGALAARLRTLSNLGGATDPGNDPGVEQLVRVLRRSRRASSAQIRAFMALVALAPERAAGLLFRAQPALLLERPGDGRELLLALEDHGVLGRGVNWFWRRFAGRVRARLGARRAAVWLRELMAAWPGGPRAVPNLGALECCEHDLAGPWPATGGELIARSRERLAILLATPTPRLPAALLDDPVAVQRLLWLRSGPPGARPARETALKNDLASLRDDRAKVDVATILSLARALAPRRPRPLARRFLLGCHPAGAAPAVDLPGASVRARHRLRFLDKREDLFAFLRFADCVPCCFDSTSSWYRTHGTGYWVRSLWQDPLSYCFHVERRERSGWTPCGFVFGGFSVAGSGPALLLNGVYLRRQHPPLRAAVLRAIEDTLCRPLGIRRLAVANRYAGYGALPSGYVRCPALIHRPRALRYPGGPARYVYDDISSAVNRTVCVDDLYWKAVDPARRIR